MSEALKILICDDQAMIHETLSEYLKVEGFTWMSAYDGDEAIKYYKSYSPDLIVLDLMMPKISGLEICKEIRQESQVPIIMLTAKGEEFDRVLGIELGADDYIVKPFSPRELVARIKAVFRRTKEQPKESDKSCIRFPGIEINLESYEVLVDGVSAQFTPKEVEVLYLLASQPGRVFDREQILARVWGYDYYGDTRVVDTQIKRIRQKLPSDTNEWGIKSIYGVGYKFECRK
jgi:DNA-binding response OmpR family regulator